MNARNRGPRTIFIAALAALLLGGGAYAYRNAQASEGPEIQTNGAAHQTTSTERNERNGQPEKDNDGDEKRR